MFSTEQKVKKESDYYIYTASSQATKAYFYPIVLGNFIYEPGYAILRSSYDSYLLFYVRSGNCTIDFNGQIYQVHEGQIVFLNCYLPHGYKTTDGYEALWLHFDGTLASTYYDMIIGIGSPVIDIRDTYQFTKNLQKLYETFRDKKPYKEALFNNWIVNILTELLVSKDTDRTDTISTDLSDELINYMNEHLSEELTLEMLAAKVSLSPFYFTRLFKKETGFTPHEYVITARINAAKYLLKTTDHSIKEICFQTGFQNESSFCTTFKKRTGNTPTAYRNQIT